LVHPLQSSLANIVSLAPKYMLQRASAESDSQDARRVTG
jgi:hypothetical protein